MILALALASAGPPALAKPFSAAARSAPLRRRGPAASGISGAWRGRYWYDDGGEGVEFLAFIDDVGGALSGEIEEPNTISPAPVKTLRSILDGMRNGRQVSFLKSYDGGGGIDHSVQYFGEADGHFTRISGVWRIFQETAGGFEMEREGFGQAIAVPLEAEASAIGA